MHEMSVATTLLAQVLTSAEANRLTTIETVTVELGQLRLVVPEALGMAFAALATGTLAAGARLELHDIPAQARCRACGKSYAPGIDDFRCPACGRAEAEILAGDDIILRSLAGSTDDGEDDP